MSLFGCTHKHTTFPQKHNGGHRIVCVDCGREFGYDWDRMSIVGELPRTARLPYGHETLVQVEHSNAWVEWSIWFNTQKDRLARWYLRLRIGEDG